jgi:hypothetical protein
MSSARRRVRVRSSSLFRRLLRVAARIGRTLLVLAAALGPGTPPPPPPPRPPVQATAPDGQVREEE